MVQPIIKTISLSKNYDMDCTSVQALKNVSIEISEKDFVVISGPSGAGKTTLLNILGGLDRPTSGEVFIKDTKLNNLKEDELATFRCANIGYVFQSYNLISTLTAEENIRFAMELSGTYGEKNEKRAAELLKLVKLEDRGTHLPCQLSGGEQQRVAFARALAADPEIILADEPTGNLDEETSLEIVNILKTLKKGSKTIIIITHDAKLFELANYRIAMRNGEIV